MALILVIDDDRAIRHLVTAAFTQSDVTVVAAEGPEEGLRQLDERSPDVVLLDVMLAGSSGLDLFDEIHRRDPALPVVFITASEDSDTAIQAMKVGAYDYLLKPLDLDKVRDIVQRAVQIRRMSVPVEVPGQSSKSRKNDLLVGCGSKMQQVYKDIGRVAGQDVTVLIRGESGTGKELIARAIYQHSSRAKGRFLAINCAAIPDALLESELFGHEKGSFTGADARRVGKFEQCAGGTLFLDEIGDMSSLVQAKMLRVLQEHEFQRVGGNEVLKADVRVIAATHRDLEAMVREGTFREDLYYRLSAFTIHAPPLRDRREDLPLLLRHFLEIFGREMHRDVRDFSAEALQELVDYNWPGNVRELQNILRQSILNNIGPVLSVDALPPKIVGAAPAPVAGAIGPRDDSDLQAFIDERIRSKSDNLYAEALERMERYLVTRVLSDAQGNQSTAASALGITRGSLRNKIRALGISIDHQVKVADELDPVAT